MRKALCGLIAAAMLVLVWTAGAQTTARTKKVAPKTAGKSAPHRTTAKRAATHAKSGSKTTAANKTATARKSTSGRKTASASARHGKRGTASARRTTWRNRQAVPTPDRYKEIQQALVAKGYLNPGAATGTWDQTSIDALKKFQTAQNIEVTGKLNSLSLIALGLGPKHDTATVLPPPPPPVPMDSGAPQGR